MGAYLEIRYCVKAQFGNGSFSSGSTRMYENEVATWIVENTNDGFPILITSIIAIKGEIGNATKVKE